MEMAVGDLNALLLVLFSHQISATWGGKKRSKCSSPQAAVVPEHKLCCIDRRSFRGQSNLKSIAGAELAYKLIRLKW